MPRTSTALPVAGTSPLGVASGPPCVPVQVTSGAAVPGPSRVPYARTAPSWSPKPGPATASGKAAIREVLTAFLDMKGTLEVLATTAVVNGDIALTHTRWRLDVPGGEPMESVTAEVVRRQPDGTWKYLIDNPWGGSILEAIG